MARAWGSTSRHGHGTYVTQTGFNVRHPMNFGVKRRALMLNRVFLSIAVSAFTSLTVYLVFAQRPSQAS